MKLHTFATMLAYSQYTQYRRYVLLPVTMRFCHILIYTVVQKTPPLFI